MKKIYLWGFLLTSLFYVNAQGIASNSGFENFTGNTPNNWTLIDEGITTAEETVIVNQGSKSLKVTLTTDNQEITDLRQNLSVENGVTYNVSLKVYHPSTDNDARARLFLNGFSVYSNPNITDQWQTVTATYTATANASIQVGVRFYDVTPFNGSSVIYIDDFLMEDQTLSIKTFEALTFSMYPNPSSNGFVNIKTSSKEAIQVSVFDILGKQVINTTLNAERLNVSSLKSGIYAVRLSQGNNTITKKLLIK